MSQRSARLYVVPATIQELLDAAPNLAGLGDLVMDEFALGTTSCVRVDSPRGYIKKKVLERWSPNRFMYYERHNASSCDSRGVVLDEHEECLAGTFLQPEWRESGYAFEARRSLTIGFDASTDDDDVVSVVEGEGATLGRAPEPQSDFELGDDDISF